MVVDETWNYGAPFQIDRLGVFIGHRQQFICATDREDVFPANRNGFSNREIGVNSQYLAVVKDLTRA